jgi:hypothetical protein
MQEVKTEKRNFAKRDKSKPVLQRLSLAGNLGKPLLSLYWTEWRKRVFELRYRTKQEMQYQNQF